MSISEKLFNLNDFDECFFMFVFIFYELFMVGVYILSDVINSF